MIPLPRAPLLLLAVGAVAAPAAWAQTPEAAARADSLCRRQLEQRNIPHEQESECQFLAAAILDRWNEPALKSAMLLDRVPPRDFQSRASGEPAKSGAAGQSEAVPTAQPLALAGGSLSAVGSEGGTDAIAAFTLNPAMLLGVQDKMKAASLTRLLDLTVLVPINDLDRDEDGTIDYYGIRARLNILGAKAGNRLAAAARALGQQAQQAAELADLLEVVLTRATDLDQCVDVYMAPGSTLNLDALRVPCGEALDVRPNAGIIAAFRAGLARARDSVDAQYLGLDLRYDNGDPTLGATPGAAGKTLFAGLAFGRRIVGTDPSRPTYGIKARVGFQHVELDDETLPVDTRRNTAVDGALAFDFTYPHEFRPLTLAAGLEFRHGDPPIEGAEKAFRTNYTQVRLSLDVPITAAQSVSIGFAGPLSGKEKPTLSVNVNWQLLLAGVIGQP